MELRDQYVDTLKQLMPKGIAWTRSIGSIFHQLFQAMAEEMARFDSRISVDLINEMDPRTCLEMLDDWERIVGLPDACQTSLSVGVTLRRIDVLRKLVSKGSQSRQFFIDLAAAFGYTITITEIRPFRSGMNVSGDRCYDVDWWHHWVVNSSTRVTSYFLSGSSHSGDALKNWANGTLECVIQAVKPAHTVVHFTYGS